MPPSTVTERHCRILVELGHGGTSDVYLAVSRGSGGFNKLVVLKALKRDIARERAARRMFLSEARLSARLNHPNVVQVNEVIEQDGVPIIVMEYLEGRALAQLLRRSWERFPLGLHLRVLSDALRGLHYSHEICDYDGTPLEVVHRDMSPHNVFVTFDGQVKVLDFGLAKIGGSADTQTGVVRGKLHYMAPDQLTQDRAIDRRADIFSVGVMLWEALTGRRLWEGVSEPVIMRRILEGRIPTPSSVNPEVPASLERTCMRALALRPEDRQGSAAELAAELDAAAAALDLPNDSRSLGEFLVQEFGEARQAMHRLIEEKLGTDDGVTGTLTRRSPQSERLDGQATAGAFAGPTRTVTNLPPPRRPRWRRLAMVAAVTGLAIGVTVYRARSPAPQGEPALASAAPSVALPAPPTVAILRVTAFPASARVLLAGRDTGANPCTEEIAIGSELSLRVEAPGHLPLEQRLHIVGDQELVLSLEPLPKPIASALTPTPKVAVAAPRPIARPPRAVDCSPPYYLDARGVKKFKPDCL